MSRPRRPAIAWRDLLALTRRERAIELCLPLPWLALALWFGGHGAPLLSALCSFVLFMTGLRVTHGAFHRSLGLSERANDSVMFALSVLLGGSMHAIEHTHLAHHADSLLDDDVEGRIAHLSFGRALLHSPMYPWHIHATAMRLGNARTRRWVRRELIVVAIVQAAIWSLDALAALRVLSIALLIANLSAAMVGIWAVHHGCEHDGFIARSSRWPLLDRLVGNMFLHLEHHLYPAVPTCRLPELVRRFDAARVDPLRLVHPVAVAATASSVSLVLTGDRPS